MDPKPIQQSHLIARQPSNALLSSALAGLLGVGLVTACGSDTPQQAVPRPDKSPGGGVDAGPSGSPSPTTDPVYSNVLSTTPISFAEFTQLCSDHGGFVTTNASCAGSNLCRGLSYLTDGNVLTDHSCKGMNSCAGMSCAELPKDTGLTGKEIYEGGPCVGCHNDAVDGPATYVVFAGPGVSTTDALAVHKNSSALRLESLVAFGTVGINQNGTAYSNMPSYRLKYSRAEIERVVAYARTLETHTRVYSVPGDQGTVGP